MASAQPSWRRWFQFNIVTMLLLIVVVGVAALYVNVQRENGVLLERLRILDTKVWALDQHWERVLEVEELAKTFARSRLSIEEENRLIRGRSQVRENFKRAFDRRSRDWSTTSLIELRRAELDAKLVELFALFELERAEAEKQAVPTN
jgi:hypothetical protein